MHHVCVCVCMLRPTFGGQSAPALGGNTAKTFAAIKLSNTIKTGNFIRIIVGNEKKNSSYTLYDHIHKTARPTVDKESCIRFNDSNIKL